MPVNPFQIVEQARKYLGVAFGSQGRARLGDLNGHMDCVGIVLCVGEDLGLRDKLGALFLRTDTSDYGPQPMSEFVEAECRRRLELKASSAPLELGNVITLKIPNVICHVAIVTRGEPNPAIIYAFPVRLRRRPGTAAEIRRRRNGCVVETDLGQLWRRRIASAFAFPGVEK